MGLAVLRAGLLLVLLGLLGVLALGLGAFGPVTADAVRVTAGLLVLGTGAIALSGPTRPLRGSLLVRWVFFALVAVTAARRLDASITTESLRRIGFATDGVLLAVLSFPLVVLFVCGTAAALGGVFSRLVLWGALGSSVPGVLLALLADAIDSPLVWGAALAFVLWIPLGLTTVVVVHLTDQAFRSRARAHM